MPEQPGPQMQNLPPQPTSFIGRDTEIARIRELLLDSDCRLLSLVGVGGIGKTRLAIQSASGLTANFAQGIHFAPLQSINAVEFLVSAVAEAVNFSLSGHQKPLTQLLNYLSDKTMLLLLDNFEQLVEQGGPAILSEILAAASGIKLLVTTREILNLREEWRYPVEGLPAPETLRLDDIESGDAVQLFVTRARQVRPDFSPAEQPEAVLRICQRVEGIPLAIELAASWTRTLSCRAIAAEIQRSIDFLVTPLRNIPDRHRSMAAVFDYSWQRLSQAEQQVFKLLSVFRGGFQQEAAERVAGASLAVLASLVDKSLLRREAGDRYQIHELLRQYAQAQLEKQAEELVRTYQDHCAYYADFLDKRREAIESGDQRGVVIEIEAELDNVRAAWQWAISQTQVAEIHKLAQTFTVYCHYRSRYLEAANTFASARESLAGREPRGQTGLALADILVKLGWFYIRLGKFNEAQAVLSESHTLFDRLGAAPLIFSGADPLPPLAILATIRGDYDEAVRLGQLARQFNEARNDRQNLAFAYYVLTSATLARGDYDAARQHARQACKVAKQAGNRWFLAYCLNEWGKVARAVGDYAEAEQHFQESYRIRESFEDPEGMAVALNHLGEIAIRQADFGEAKRRYRQSVAIYEEINDKGGLASALDGLGQIASVLNDYSSAVRYFERALTIAGEIQFLPLICVMFISIGELFLKLGRPEQGLTLLALSLHHPASGQETKDRAAQILKQQEARFTPEQIATVLEQGQQPDLETLLAAVQSDLTSLPGQFRSHLEPSPGDDAPAPSATPDPALLDSLTERELEVLRLIAAGRTNREIGADLVLALGSVKWYASQIYGKLRVKNRTEAAAKARQLNLLS